MARSLDNWIEAFCKSTAGLPTPDLFRTWTAIAAVAGALERKVWIRTYGSELFPTLYTVLVGGPGIGKTILSKRVFRLWKQLPEHQVASTNVTKASIVDELDQARRAVSDLDALTSDNGTFNSLLVACNELGQLLPQYSSEFMNFLTDVYDGEPYTESRRGNKNAIDIQKPQINILACTTPSFLNEFMHEGAWDQGFISRTMLIFSKERKVRSLFEAQTEDSDLNEKLLSDLKHIGSMFGQMKFTENAAIEIDDWHMKGGLPRPDHPRLVYYVERRTQHVLKLAMVACAATTDDRIITRTHVRTALQWLYAAEKSMPDIFKSMTNGGGTRIVADTWFFAQEQYLRTGKPVPEEEIVRFVQDRCSDAYKVDPIIKTMVRSKILNRDVSGGYIPAKQSKH